LIKGKLISRKKAPIGALIFLNRVNF